MSDEERANNHNKVVPRETLINSQAFVVPIYHSNAAAQRKVVDEDLESMPLTENSEAVASEIFTNTMLS